MSKNRVIARAGVAAAVALCATLQAGAQGNARLWLNPPDIASRNLFWGPGEASRVPKGPFTFVEEDKGGTQPKIVVRDADGRQYDVKFGEEVHSEIAASRLVWALGYVTDELYFVREGRLTAATGNFGRAKRYIGTSGDFRNARFHYKDPAIRSTETKWAFDKNPFTGSKELSGLAILMTMLNNWDIMGERNNGVIERNGETLYFVSDLGATFGKMGRFPMPRSKWDLRGYQGEDFIEKIEAGFIDLDYEGYGGFNKVPIDHARWFAGLVSQLSDQQIQDAFRAAGATDNEIAAYAKRLREKITELQQAVGGTQ